MIVLDTHVVSELSRPTPDPSVVSWVDAQRDPAIAAPALGELRLGVPRLPAGKRRTALAEAIDQFVLDDLGGLVLAFDAACADAYGPIVAARERGGRPIATTDAQIAAICAVHDAPLATRTIRDFIDTLPGEPILPSGQEIVDGHIVMRRHDEHRDVIVPRELTTSPAPRLPRDSCRIECRLRIQPPLKEAAPAGGQLVIRHRSSRSG